MATDDFETETLGRLRRIETRLTRYLVRAGHEHGARLPVRIDHEIHAPGYYTTLADLLDTVPESLRGGRFDVLVDGYSIASLITSEVRHADTGSPVLPGV
jgi:hypothetical protein